uniref:Solute-binding protein family 3/N-terminal domain-containing protein n=1 Tax=Tetranychus urticae TaxID=32264 RepID=T1KQM2_TETUR
MRKINLTVGAFTVPFAQGFDEEDGEIVPHLKALKGFAAMLTSYGPYNVKFILPDSGQLGALTESGYDDGVLGLMQEGKADMCFLPLPLDTQKAPGHFTSVISEQLFYVSTVRNLDDNTSTVVSSLTSISVIPVLLAILSILILELIAVNRFKIEALLTAIYKSFGISLHQHFTQHYKIDTLKDAMNKGKIPFFIEGISKYDFFKAQVTKDYADVYERSVAAGLDEPFPLGPIPVFERRDKMVTFVSGIGKKLTPLLAAASLRKNNQEQYFSVKPFHRSLQSMLFGYTADSARIRWNTLAHRLIQGGISSKIESDVFVGFILSFYPASLYDFHKSEDSRNAADLTIWFLIAIIRK